MKIKNAAAKILLPVMILSFLVSCASKKSGNTDIKQDTAQGTAQNSDAMDDDIPRNPYGDTDFSRPQGFDEKRDGVDYGYMNDRVIYYSSTIGKDKMCGVLLPAGYDEKKKYPSVIPTQFNAGSFWNKPILEDFEIKSEETKPVYLSLMVGSRDPWCLDSTRYYHQKLTEEGIKHDYFEVEGSGHDDDVWKAGLYNLFKRCF